jgi:hypothetical protein
MRSVDGRVEVDLSGGVAPDLPTTSIFRTLDEASARSWAVAPLAIDRVYSSYFANEASFPAASVSFDCALIMRNVAHEWHAGEPMYV